MADLAKSVGFTHVYYVKLNGKVHIPVKISYKPSLLEQYQAK